MVDLVVQKTKGSTNLSIVPVQANQHSRMCDGRWLFLVVNGEGRSGQPPPRLVVGQHGDGWWCEGDGESWLGFLMLQQARHGEVMA
ncbi:hypothetical protein Dimus_016700 [Dionaea muscipula]